MNTEQLNSYKELLLTEKKTLEAELNRRGRKLSDEDGGDWMAIPEEEDGFRADDNENADDIEDFEANVAIVTELEKQHALVIVALGRIDEETYGICRKCSGEIESDRLKSNPTSTTCVEHMNL